MVLNHKLASKCFGRLEWCRLICGLLSGLFWCRLICGLLPLYPWLDHFHLICLLNSSTAFNRFWVGRLQCVVSLGWVIREAGFLHWPAFISSLHFGFLHLGFSSFALHPAPASTYRFHVGFGRLVCF